jgi:hypothetical protein
MLAVNAACVGGDNLAVVVAAAAVAMADGRRRTTEVAMKLLACVTFTTSDNCRADTSLFSSVRPFFDIRVCS